MTKHEALLAKFKERETAVNQFSAELLQQVVVALATLQAFLIKRGDVPVDQSIRWTQIIHMENQKQVYLVGSYNVLSPTGDKLTLSSTPGKPVELPVRVLLPYEIAVEEDVVKITAFLEQKQKEAAEEEARIVKHFHAAMDPPKEQEFVLSELTEEQQKALKLSQAYSKGKPN